MLLLIALANVHVYAFGHALGSRGYPRDLAALDRVVVVVQMLFVDGRAYPLFALLFGYGIVQLSRRHQARGLSADEVTTLVRRRGWWMILIGLIHGIVLWPGDIIAAYGLIAVLFAGVLVRRSNSAVVVMAVVGTLLSALLLSGASLPMPGDSQAQLPSMAEDSALSAMVIRVVEWVGIGLLAGSAMSFGAVALGVLAARRGILDEPERAVPALRLIAVGGLVTAVVFGLPQALIAGGLVPPPTIGFALLFGLVHALGGYAGGLGYAAAFGLLAVRLRNRSLGPVSTAVVESGRRSMSSYLAQSVVFVALLPAWTIGLGGVLVTWQLSLLAVVVWGSITALSALAGRAGFRGPAEVLVRRLTYGRRPPVSG